MPKYKKKQMKCRTCGKPITKENAVPEGFCFDCKDKTQKLLEKLDKMIPYEG